MVLDYHLLRYTRLRGDDYAAAKLHGGNYYTVCEHANCIHCVRRRLDLPCQMPSLTGCSRHSTLAKHTTQICRVHAGHTPSCTQTGHCTVGRSCCIVSQAFT